MPLIIVVFTFSFFGRPLLLLLPSCLALYSLPLSLLSLSCLNDECHINMSCHSNSCPITACVVVSKCLRGSHPTPERSLGFFWVFRCPIFLPPQHHAPFTRLFLHFLVFSSALAALLAPSLLFQPPTLTGPALP